MRLSKTDTNVIAFILFLTTILLGAAIAATLVHFPTTKNAFNPPFSVMVFACIFGVIFGAWGGPFYRIMMKDSEAVLKISLVVALLMALAGFVFVSLGLGCLRWLFSSRQ